VAGEASAVRPVSAAIAVAAALAVRPVAAELSAPTVVSDGEFRKGPSVFLPFGTRKGCADQRPVNGPFFARFDGHSDVITGLAFGLGLASGAVGRRRDLG
jgi:hypothetical protein